jgi:aryl-alcohol dehydrogenase-like predicted oxidoreductase
MLHRQKVEVEFSQIYKTVGLGTTIWSPLASGILTGKYSKGIGDDYRLNREELDWLRDMNVVNEKLAVADKIVVLAKDLGCTGSQLAIAWCLKNPDVSTVILGASRVEQLRENLKAAAVVHLLTAEVMENIENILNNKPHHPPF